MAKRIRIRMDGLEIRFDPAIVREALIRGFVDMGLVRRADLKFVRVFVSRGQAACKIWIRKPEQVEMFPDVAKELARETPTETPAS